MPNHPPKAKMALPFDVDDAAPLGMDPDVGVPRQRESEHHKAMRVFGVGWVRAKLAWLELPRASRCQGVMLGELGTCQPALTRAESAGALSCKRVPRSDE